MEIREIIKEKIVIFDGAMGTNIQKFSLNKDDYCGFEGCNEYLVLSRPDIIEKIHANFFAVGCDVVETNTFGANKIVLADYGLKHKVYKLNKTAAEIAKKTADKYSSTKPRFVSGSIGPGTKLPTLGQIQFDELKFAYHEQALGLIDGGVDLFQIETSQDMLQIKAAIQGVELAKKEKNKNLPIIVQVTMEQTGTMLLGTDIKAVIATFQNYDLFALGLNCATGPEAMRKYVKELSMYSPFYISVLPNAGLPQFINGEYQYTLTPEKLSEELLYFVREFGVRIFGGCCGTTYEHLKTAVDKIEKIEPKDRNHTYLPSFSSLYCAQESKVEPKPLIIGERTNATGSKKFREALLKENFDQLLEIAKEQEKEGAHLIDVSVGYAGRNEEKDLEKFIEKLNTSLHVPISVDTTNLEALEKALKKISGKPLINSINLENGEEKARKILKLAKQFNASLVCLCIDEKGMATTKEKKIEIAERIYQLATNEFNIKPEELFFDCLTFTLASGDKNYYDSAKETLEAIKIIKQKFPRCNTVLGLTNISYGLNQEARKILNSVFLYSALQYGLDAAILQAAKIIPISQIPQDLLKIAEDLIFNKRSDNYDPLQKFIKYFEKKTVEITATSDWQNFPIEEKLRKHIIDAKKTDIQKNIETALKKYSPLEIINNFLLEGMRTVGQLFGSGKMQLPFVLESAETIKAAVKILEPYLQKKIEKLGTIILATVKGDIHDIGKNLVDIIMTNNGYQIINLGVNISAEKIIEAQKKYQGDAIGLSGLLVKSTEEMKNFLDVFSQANLNVPVICGGAALTPNYVEEVLNAIYPNKVFYAKDAFSAIKIMENIKNEKTKKINRNNTPTQQKIKLEQIENKKPVNINENIEIPWPSFWGRKIIKNINFEKVLPFLNKNILFSGRWELKSINKPKEEYYKIIQDFAEPKFQEIITKAKKDSLLDLKAIYGFYPCCSENSKIIILDPLNQKERKAEFIFPVQKNPPYLCLSNYFKNLTEEKDVICFYIVTIGDKASKESKRLFESNNYQDYLLWHGFSVQLAEALAEYIHYQIRCEMNIAEYPVNPYKYQGKRYSFGFPSCPNLEDQKKLFNLLHPEDIGLSLTENYQLVPEQSTSGLVIHNKNAVYFEINN